MNQLHDIRCKDIKPNLNNANFQIQIKTNFVTSGTFKRTFKNISNN